MTNQSKFISKNALHSLHDEWPERDDLRFQSVNALLLIATLPESLTHALNFVRPRTPHVEVTKIDVARKFVMQPNLQPALTASYRYWSLLFSAPGLAEPELGMNRSRCDKNRKMYMPTMLKKRNTGKSSLEACADTGGLEMKAKCRQ